MRQPLRVGRSALCAAFFVFSIGASSGCGGLDVNTVLEKAWQARQIAADLLVDFTKAADAANRAVMAETDASSVAFAQEAERAAQAVQNQTGALGPILQELNYADEARLLKEFEGHFVEYRA